MVKKGLQKLKRNMYSQIKDSTVKPKSVHFLSLESKKLIVDYLHFLCLRQSIEYLLGKKKFASGHEPLGSHGKKIAGAA